MSSSVVFGVLSVSIRLQQEAPTGKGKKVAGLLRWARLSPQCPFFLFDPSLLCPYRFLNDGLRVIYPPRHHAVPLKSMLIFLANVRYADWGPTRTPCTLHARKVGNGVRVCRFGDIYYRLEQNTEPTRCPRTARRIQRSVESAVSTYRLWSHQGLGP